MRIREDRLHQKLQEFQAPIRQQNLESLHSRMGLAGRSPYLKMWNGLFAQEPDACPLVYLQAQDYVVGVDSMEKKENEIEGRSYVLANPQLKDYPLIGEARGKDDPEKIIEINPQFILKTSMIGQAVSPTATDADALQDKTGIPVVSFPYGSLNNETQKAEMHSSLRIMGKVVGKQDSTVIWALNKFCNKMGVYTGAFRQWSSSGRLSCVYTQKILLDNGRASAPLHYACLLNLCRSCDNTAL
jgi:hypothetical protein